MLEIISIPILNDNYVWLIKNANKKCCIVDPGDAAPVLNVIQQQGLTLEAILITHGHYDHIGGIGELLSAPSNEITLYIPQSLPISHPAINVSEGDQLSLLDNELQLTVMATPGHKAEHVVYHNSDMLFSGDTLFSAGCGRILDGTPAQLFDSLQRIADLPEVLKIYPAHEYTQANLMFGHAVEPANKAINAHIHQVAKLRQQGLPTVPSTLAHEKQVNVFLRCHEPRVQFAVENHQHVICDSEEAVFSALRAWKDMF